jgi:hypothetical protein
MSYLKLIVTEVLLDGDVTPAVPPAVTQNAASAVPNVLPAAAPVKNT